MQMLYNSDNFVVMQFDVPTQRTGPDGATDDTSPTALTRGGYEIVDKFARKEIFIEGAMAQSFKEGVEALIETSPSEDDMDRLHRTLHLADAAARDPALTRRGRWPPCDGRAYRPNDPAGTEAKSVIRWPRTALSSGRCAIRSNGAQPVCVSRSVVQEEPWSRLSTMYAQSCRPG